MSSKVYGDVSFLDGVGAPVGAGGFRAGSVTLGSNTDYAVAIGDGTIEDDHVNGICLGAGTLLGGQPGDYAYGYFASTFGTIYDMPGDGATLTINDGILPSPVVLEFDDDDSVVETTYLRKVDLNLVAGIGDLHSLIADVVNASALSITSSYAHYTYGRPPTTTNVWITEFFHDVQGAYNYPINLVGGVWCNSVGGMEGGVSPDPAYGGVCLGDGDSQAQSYSVAIGPGAVAQDINSFALGSYAGVYASVLGDSQDSIAIGDEAVVEDAYYSFALGSFSYVSGTQSVAIGDSASCTTAKAVAIGVNSSVTGGGVYGSVAIGFASSALYDGDVAIGPDAVCKADHAVAIGRAASADEQSIALGWEALAVGFNCFAAGVQAYATDESVAMGLLTVADNKSIAWGRSTTADNYSVAVGFQASADNNGLAFGTNSSAMFNYTFAMGYNAEAGHARSFVFGRDATTTAENQFVIGSVGTYGMDVICSRGVTLGDSALTTAGTLRWNTGALQVHNGTSWLGLSYGTQVAKINDPSGGTTVDAEARTAINSIIDALEAFRLSSAT